MKFVMAAILILMAVVSIAFGAFVFLITIQPDQKNPSKAEWKE